MGSILLTMFIYSAVQWLPSFPARFQAVHDPRFEEPRRGASLLGGRRRGWRLVPRHRVEYRTASRWNNAATARNSSREFHLSTHIFVLHAHPSLARHKQFFIILFRTTKWTEMWNRWYCRRSATLLWLSDRRLRATSNQWWTCCSMPLKPKLKIRYVSEVYYTQFRVGTHFWLSAISKCGWYHFALNWTVLNFPEKVPNLM